MCGNPHSDTNYALAFTENLAETILCGAMIRKAPSDNADLNRGCRLWAQATLLETISVLLLESWKCRECFGVSCC